MTYLFFVIHIISRFFFIFRLQRNMQSFLFRFHPPPPYFDTNLAHVGENFLFLFETQKTWCACVFRVLFFFFFFLCASVFTCNAKPVFFFFFTYVIFLAPRLDCNTIPSLFFFTLADFSTFPPRHAPPPSL